MKDKSRFLINEIINSTVERSNSISRNFLACWIGGKRRTRSVVRFRVPLRRSRATNFKVSASCQSLTSEWRVKEGRGADESNAEFSVKLFQNQIVDSYGNTQDVKISRKLNSKSFHLLFRGLRSMNEREVFEVLKQKFGLIDFQEEILFSRFFRNFHDCIYCDYIIKDILFFFCGIKIKMQ